jgi:transcription initiation factor TFIIIB Brf1 subunit/transcription initiation factor TFIIB
MEMLNTLTDLAVRVIVIAENQLLTIGRDPTSIAAAALIIATECHCKKVDLDPVFEILCVKKVCLCCVFVRWLMY